MKRQYLLNTILFLLLFTGEIALVDAQINEKRDDAWSVKIENSYLNNFWKINDTIYRSEQPHKKDFVYLNNLGFRAVLNLRTCHTDKKLINNFNIVEYNVKMKAGHFGDKEIIESIKVIRDSPKPLIVHCWHGSDRTGVVIAMFRIIYQNWTKEQALLELQNGGYGFHTVFSNIQEYIKNVDVENIRSEVIR